MFRINNVFMQKTGYSCETREMTGVVLNIPGLNSCGVKKFMMPVTFSLSSKVAADGTGWVEGVTVFGSNRVSQLASTVNAMLTFVAPLGLAILLFAFLLSIVAYLVLL